MFLKLKKYHSVIYSLICVLLIYILHIIPINQLFIDPFSEAIKKSDLMDIAFSKFRKLDDPNLFDSRILILNSGITDRTKVAQTVSFLHRKNVGAIGLDLLFDSLYADISDTLLHNALAQTDKDVIGFSFSEHKKNSSPELRSAEYFTCVSTEAHINLATNDGFSVRTFEPYYKINNVELTSFSLELAHRIDSNINTTWHPHLHEKEWINFKRVQPGQQNMKFPFNSNKYAHYAYMSIDKFLTDTASFDSTYLKGKIVLIGFNGENDDALSLKDRYYTPLNELSSGRSLPDMHGVVIHANIISMLLDGDYIYEIPELFLYMITFIIFMINYHIFKKVEQKHFFFTVASVRLIQALQFVLFLSLCIILLSKFNIKVGFILIITAVILSFELYEFYEHKLKAKINLVLHKYFPNT